MNGIATTTPGVWLGFAAFAVAAAVSYGLLFWLRPVLQRYALARPNARSSHIVPTPQGGGIAVIGVTLTLPVIVVSAMPAWAGAAAPQFAVVAAATLLLAAAGMADDIRGFAQLPRLALHIVAVAIMVAALPSELRVVPAVPWWIERTLLLLAGVWFINLVNFMDGVDWMTVAEVVPVAAGFVMAGALGAMPPLGTLTAIVLAGAMIGFAPFNRPVASVFLGDVGSVPIGLILAWLLLLLAAGGHLAAALLLPLYYLADATITLGRRLVRGEKIWQAHRTHFYQRATDNGYTVRAIVGRVFAVNLGLVALAAATIAYPSAALDTVALALGAVLVGALLCQFSGRWKRA
ncbi:MAG: glycosyl transferase [Rhizobiales bacterium]|nr:glycosyl transferase [Hyphomicrobiales bacterium]